MEVGSEDVAKTGLKGKGLKLLHVHGDQLWGLGAKSLPDPSFTPQRIFPLQAKLCISCLGLVPEQLFDNLCRIIVVVEGHLQRTHMQTHFSVR